jgi:hypothetical protein
LWIFHVDAPWGEDGQSPTYDICSCCGVEFGYEDCFVQSTKKYRKNWIDEGGLWNEPQFRPENWDLDKQLKQVPKEFI